MKKYALYVVAFIGLIFAGIFGYEKAVRFSFDSETTKGITYQVFYTTSPDMAFSQQYSVKKSVGQGDKHVNIYLPTEYAHRIRLDIGQQPGNVTLKNFYVSGFGHLSADKFSPNSHIQKFDTSGNQITLTSDTEDPYISYTDAVNATAVTRILLDNLLWILMGCAWLYWVLTNMKKEDFYDNVDKKIHTLGFLRLFFSISVVCTHFFAPLHIPKYGGSVEFFFLLSGYFLAYTFRPETTCIQYAKKKFIQLSPLVIFGSILCGGGFNAFTSGLFLQNTGLAFHDAANSPAWYVGVLFWVALFYLFVLKIVKDKDKRNLLIGLIVFISCVIVAQLPADRREMAFGFFPRGLFRGLSCVGLGILSQQIVKRDTVAPTMKYTIMESIVLFIAIAMMFYMPSGMHYWIYRPIRYAPLMILFISQRGHLSQWLNKPIFSKMARYSLAIYLTHFWITSKPYGTMWAIKTYRPEWLTDEKGLVIFLVLTSAILLGIASYYLIERPATKLLKKYLK